MATLRKRKGSEIYQARFRVPVLGPDGSIVRERREVSTGQRDRKLAKEVARRLEREALAIADGPALLRLDVAIAQHLAHLDALRRSPATLRFYVQKAAHLTRIFDHAVDVHRLGPADATRYMHTRLLEAVRGHAEGKGGSKRVHRDEEGAKPITVHTVSKELAFLRAVLRWHAAQGRFRGRSDWCVPPELRGAYKPKERALSHAEYHALREALSVERRDYLAAFVGLGCRDSELYRIDAHDLDAKTKRVHIRGTKTQRADRWSPLRPELLHALERRARMTPSGPLFARWRNVRRDLHAACKRAKIDRCSPNDLRRTCATWHAEAGTPELVVVQLMGHASSAMIRKVYARIGSQAQIDAAARFPELGPGTKKKKRKPAKKRGGKR